MSDALKSCTYPLHHYAQVIEPYTASDSPQRNPRLVCTNCGHVVELGA